MRRSPGETALLEAAGFLPPCWGLFEDRGTQGTPSGSHPGDSPLSARVALIPGAGGSYFAPGGKYELSTMLDRSSPDTPGVLANAVLDVCSWAAGRTFVVVSVKQRYFGHSTQVGLVASQVNPVGYVGRWIVVVDDDIDPSDIHDVIWAMGTRCDPKTMTTMTDRTWSSRLDTLVTDYDRLYNSRMVIDACIPYERRDTFPTVAQTSPELAAEVRAKYPSLYR